MIARPAQGPACRDEGHGNCLTSGLPLWKGRNHGRRRDMVGLPCLDFARDSLNNRSSKGNKLWASVWSCGSLWPSRCPYNLRCPAHDCLSTSAVSGLVVSCRSTKCRMFEGVVGVHPMQPRSTLGQAALHCQAARQAASPFLAHVLGDFWWPVLSCPGWVLLVPGCRLH